MLYTTVRAYRVREKGSFVVVIPKELREEIGIEQGSKFRVWKDKRRLIYELEP